MTEADDKQPNPNRLTGVGSLKSIEPRSSRELPGKSMFNEHHDLAPTMECPGTPKRFGRQFGYSRKDSISNKKLLSFMLKGKETIRQQKKLIKRELIHDD